MPADRLARAIRQLAAGQSLTRDEATGAFENIMGGEASPAQVAALLVALRVKGETPDEVAGAATAMRGAMVALAADDPRGLVDTCGTGGGSITTFNISTAAALLAAGMGVRVAKHGNRSFTSACGSADVLEALGVGIDISPARMAAVLAQAEIVFMFAPLMHPAMRHVGPVRRELGIPTVMNIVGPLANPAQAGRQVIGVAERNRLELIAGALAQLGTAHAMVVHGEPGMDEVSPLGTTAVLEVRDGTVSRWTIDPRDHGLDLADAGDLRGGGPAENAAIVRDVLGGGGTPAARGAVALNAGAALYVAGLESSYEGAVKAALAGLVDGVGLAALERLRSATAASESSHAAR